MDKIKRTQHKYRMYVDESGTSSYSKSEAIGHRFLALVGLAVRMDHNLNHLQPKMRDLKLIVAEDVDCLPILHRQEIANRQGDYAALADKSVEQRWNQAVFEIIDKLEFALFTVVIDKQSLEARYGDPMPPYHYCLASLVELYAKYLRNRGGRGDIMLESRSPRDDNLLDHEYRVLREIGSSQLDPEELTIVLTSKKLKFRPKDRGVAGLELADLLVLAAKLGVLQDGGVINKIQSQFTRKLVDLLESRTKSNPPEHKLFIL